MDIGMEKVNWPEYYWDHLAKLESVCLEKNFSLMKGWDTLAEKCMLISIKAPFLLKEIDKPLSLNVASVFMKRCMSDFRGAWWMLNLGYPYQAACIAASLYEHSLIVDCISNRDDLARQVIECKNGDIPWNPKKLAQMAAQRDIYGSIGDERSLDERPLKERYNSAWRLSYHNYKLLCKMKHPTIQQLKEEAKNTKLPNGQFVVVPKPFELNNNMPVSHMIMIIIISRLFSAAKCFAMSVNLPVDDQNNIEFFNLCNEVYELLLKNIENSDIKSLPIEVCDFSFS
ncbi:TPA: hypothetical protein ACSTJX_004735 [Serratia fonticola]